MSKRSNALSKDGRSKPETFEMDAPIPEDLGVYSISFWWDTYDSVMGHAPKYIVPMDYPKYFVDDEGTVYETRVWNKNYINQSIDY